MKENSQYETIRAFFCEKLNCKADELSEDTDLTLFGDYNSMLVVEIILFIEENFQIVIPDEYFGLENYKTIGHILAMFERIGMGSEKNIGAGGN